jgi:hypothetical protein
MRSKKEIKIFPSHHATAKNIFTVAEIRCQEEQRVIKADIVLIQINQTVCSCISLEAFETAHSSSTVIVEEKQKPKRGSWALGLENLTNALNCDSIPVID